MVMAKRVIIVSNRLPISITEEAGTLTLQRSNGGLATALSGAMDEYESVWLGWTGSKEPLRRGQLHKLGLDTRLMPLNLPQRAISRYYDRMANGILWPRLHGMEPTIAYEEADWKSYLTINRKFAGTLKKITRPGDVIWVHDYHLLMLPALLRKAGVSNPVGFFLHTPFATPDCLTGVEKARAILNSLTQVDVLGFQTPRDVDNFKAALQNAGLSLAQGRTVRAFPIGVDANAYAASWNNRMVHRIMNGAKERIAGRKVLLSVSRLDYTKGILEQLRAVEGLLKHNSPTEFLYKLIVAPSREGVAGYRELKAQIAAMVHRINKKFSQSGREPIEYTYQNCGFEEVNAWYQHADAMVITPYIDGMNLVAKEYVAAKRGEGMLVLSETMGAAQQLKRALLVDPYDVSEITAALKQALHMPAQERSERWNALRNNVTTENVFWWFREFLGTLESRPHAVLLKNQAPLPRLGQLAGTLRPAAAAKLTKLRRRVQTNKNVI